MPTAFEIDVPRRLVVCRCWGVLTSDELVLHYRALRSDPAFDPTFSQLADLREVTAFDVDTRVLGSRTLVGTFAPTARRALVAPNDVGYALSYVYGRYTHSPDKNLQVFRVMRDAEQWLGLRARGTDLGQAKDNVASPDSNP
jgi:hypothetical protein